MKFYSPKYKQLDLGLLRSSLDELDKTNRWVALGDLLPWAELEKEYDSRLGNQKKGAGNTIGERNEIECSFGTGKRIYRANNIRANLPDTARCWTGMCYFVTMRDYVCYPLSVARN